MSQDLLSPRASAGGIRETWSAESVLLNQLPPTAPTWGPPGTHLSYIVQDLMETDLYKLLKSHS